MLSALTADLTKQTQAQTLFIKPYLDQTSVVDYQLGLALPFTPVSPYYIDFSAGKLGYRLLHEHSLQNDFFRALSIKSGMRPRILDCHAGLGRDSLLMAAAGCQVQSVEHHPLLYLAVSDALRRARAGTSRIATHCERLDLQFADARQALQQASSDNFDVVYLDPMFPERKKSAQVKREAQLLQHYCGADEGAEDLLQLALTQGFRRICVKRPAHAPSLGGRQADLQYKGKSTRYDVYLST